MLRITIGSSFMSGLRMNENKWYLFRKKCFHGRISY